MFRGAHAAAGEFFKGVAQGVGQAGLQAFLGLAGKAASGFKSALIGLNTEAENTGARIQAFTKNAGMTAQILADVRKEASLTPFSFRDMATAMAALLPVSKAASVGVNDLIKQAEVLAASNPLEGLEGASFALREAMTGDFTSIIERFNLSRVTINKLKDEGVPAMEIIQRAMAEMGYDQTLVTGMAETMEGRYSTLLDTLDGFKISLTKPAFDALKNALVVTQGLVDTNADAITRYASLIGDRLGAAINWAVKRLPDIGKAAWEGFGQLRDAITSGGFNGQGPFSEDSPLIVGIFAVQHGFDVAKVAVADFGTAIQDTGKKIDGLVSKLPDLAKLPGAKKAAEGVTDAAPSGLGALAGGAAAGAGLAGIAALAPMLPLLSALPTLLSALASPLGLALAGVGLLGAAWVTNFGDIQGKTAEARVVVSDFFTGTLQPALASVGPAWDRFTADASLALDTFRGAVSAAFGEFQTWLDGGIGPSLRDLQGVVAWAFGSMLETTKQLGDTIGPAFASLRSSFETFSAVASSVFAPVIAHIKDDLGPAVQGVVDFANQNIPLLASAWANVASAIGPILTGIAGAVRDFTDGVTHFMIDHRTEIVRVATDTWEAIHSAIAIPLELISGLIRTTLLAISGDWTGAWNEVKQTAADITANIGTIVGAWVDTFKTVVGGAMQWVHDRITQKWNDIKATVSDATASLGTTLDSWSEGLKTKLDTWSDTIAKLLMSPFTGARDAIGGVMSAFRDNLLGPIRGALSSFGTFGGGVAGVVNWILRAFKQPEIGVPGVPALAKGSKDFQGGLAMVGEQGPELVVLPRHAVVVPNGLTESLVANGGVPGFALGLNVPSLFDIIGKGKDWVVAQALNAVPEFAAPVLPGVMAAAGQAFFDRVKGWLTDMVTGFVKTALPVSGDQVQEMIRFAESHVGEPYTWGGGHGGAAGFDCSGFVAAVLDAGGIPNPHGIVTAFYEWMESGRTGVVDIGIDDPYAAPDVQHTGIGLMGQWYEAGGRAGGVGRTADYFSNVGHPPGWNPKAKGAGNLSDIDILQSLKNMRRGGTGQWSALANGGVIGEPVIGYGTRSGGGYVIGEKGEEIVIPLDVVPLAMAYLQEAARTGETSNSFLVGIPLELREPLKQLAARWIAAARNQTPPRTGASGGGGPRVVSPTTATGGSGGRTGVRGYTNFGPGGYLGTGRQEDDFYFGSGTASGGGGAFAGRRGSGPGLPSGLTSAEVRDTADGVAQGVASAGSDLAAAVTQGINASFLFDVFGRGGPGGAGAAGASGGTTVTVEPNGTVTVQSGGWGGASGGGGARTPAVVVGSGGGGAGGRGTRGLPDPETLLGPTGGSGARDDRGTGTFGSGAHGRDWRFPTATGGEGAGSRTVRVQVDWAPDGKTIVGSVLTDPIALDGLTDATIDATARKIDKATGGGGGRR